MIHRRCLILGSLAKSMFQSREEHLNELFDQALNKDCGKTLTKKTLPDWISSAAVYISSKAQSRHISGFN